MTEVGEYLLGAFFTCLIRHSPVTCSSAAKDVFVCLHRTFGQIRIRGESEVGANLLSPFLLLH